jgi:hypothetical protein
MRAPDESYFEHRDRVIDLGPFTLFLAMQDCCELRLAA